MTCAAIKLVAICTVLVVGLNRGADALDFNIKTNDGAISIVGYYGTNSTLVVPAKLGGLDVTSVEWLGREGYAGVDGDYARRIVLPESVTNLGPCLFQARLNLSEVNIPHGVTKIPSEAFMLTSLTNLVLPKRLQTIDKNAFLGARLGRLVIPDSVTKIGVCAFYRACLQELVMSDGVTKFEPGLFSGATIGTLVWGGGTLVRCPGESCANVGRVVARAGVKRIEDRGFCWLEGLTNVIFEGDAPDVGKEIFGTNQEVNVYYYPGTKGWGATFGGRPTFVLKIVDDKRGGEGAARDGKEAP